MICPRCEHNGIEKLHSSPVPGVWDVLQCELCLYTWRTSEPARRTRPEAYPAQFKVTAAAIANAPAVPIIPPLASDVSGGEAAT